MKLAPVLPPVAFVLMILACSPLVAAQPENGGNELEDLWESTGIAAVGAFALSSLTGLAIFTNRYAFFRDIAAGLKIYAKHIRLLHHLSTLLALALSAIHGLIAFNAGIGDYGQAGVLIGWISLGGMVLLVLTGFAFPYSAKRRPAVRLVHLALMLFVAATAGIHALVLED